MTFVIPDVGNIEMDRPPGITPTNDGVLWNIAFSETKFIACSKALTLPPIQGTTRILW